MKKYFILIILTLFLSSCALYIGPGKRTKSCKDCCATKCIEKKDCDKEVCKEKCATKCSKKKDCDK